MEPDFCSSALSVWKRCTLRPHKSCSRASALCMASEAPPFVFIGSPDMYPVPASAKSCKYLLPCMSCVVIGPVVSEDTACSGAYLLVDELTNAFLFNLPRMHASQDDSPSSAPASLMCLIASGYSFWNHASLSTLE
eukprot:Plantae.Rhodophyta-Palmaria_palmata.ctg5555.p2 GENE.Plantae.Rhodophyta-Palmaria_palmata.ctg5555~~Plantae.Rhodophyta-Palmaria_palmata.ctg5555.p2  ORF type:complete len:136 (+),score=7.05 Plantae.Rhodophyta-Palmaria_palmata.ctg5555:402-809(+)